MGRRHQTGTPTRTTTTARGLGNDPRLAGRESASVPPYVPKQKVRAVEEVPDSEDDGHGDDDRAVATWPCLIYKNETVTMLRALAPLYRHLANEAVRAEMAVVTRDEDQTKPLTSKENVLRAAIRQLPHVRVQHRRIDDGCNACERDEVQCWKITKRINCVRCTARGTCCSLNTKKVQAADAEYTRRRDALAEHMSAVLQANSTAQLLADKIRALPSVTPKQAAILVNRMRRDTVPAMATTLVSLARTGDLGNISQQFVDELNLNTKARADLSPSCMITRPQEKGFRAADTLGRASTGVAPSTGVARLGGRSTGMWVASASAGPSTHEKRPRSLTIGTSSDASSEIDFEYKGCLSVGKSGRKRSKKSHRM